MIHAWTRLLFARRDVVLYARALDPHEQVSVPAGYSYSELSRSDLQGCALARERGRMQRFDRRLELGYRCAGFRDGVGQVVSYIWIAEAASAPNRVAIWRDAEVTFPGTDVFFWDCRTAPGHEGRGLYRSALRLAGARVAATGARRAWIETEPNNAASHRGIEGAGFSRVAEFAIVDVLGMRLMRDRADGRWQRFPGPLRLGPDVAVGQGSAAIIG